MGITYDKVKHFEYALQIHSYKYFSEKLSLFDEMMEVYLEPLDDISSGWQLKEEKSPEIILIARMFNDFESSRLLLLNGLPEQAIMAMRDIVECSMLFRLFGSAPKLALRWMKDLKEYQPSDVKRKLDELGVDCPEHIYYGMLSQLAHVNLLSVVSRVTESKLTDEWIIQTYHFGGMNNPTWIDLVLNSLLILIFTVMWSVLPPAYSSTLKNPEGWCDKVISLGEKVEKLEIGLQIKEAEINGKTRIERDKVFRKLKIVTTKSALFDKDKIASDKGFPTT